MSKLVIENLYPEYNNLYGDRGNLLVLRRKLERLGVETEWVETGLYDEPAFVRRPVDLLYIGPCTEHQQEAELTRLAHYRDALADRMQSPLITLCTGNAIELFGQYILRAPGAPQGRERLPALGLTELHAERFLRLRYNELCLGTFTPESGAPIEVVGFKNQLSHSYGENPHPFLQMQTGTGINPDVHAEGVHQAGFFATYLIGPLLPLNPQLTAYLLQKLVPGCGDAVLPFEQEAYAKRLSELRDPAVNASHH